MTPRVEDSRDLSIGRAAETQTSSADYMAKVPDQFLFVNKSANSGSLSHSRSNEKTNIYSYVHSKYHKDRRQSRGYKSSATSESSSKTRDSATSRATKASTARVLQAPSSQSEKRQGETEKSQARHDQFAIAKAHARMNGSAVDPFFSAAVIIDAEEQSLLYYPFTGFIETTFNAESLLDNPRPQIFRHRDAVTVRLQRCLVDELTLYTTLAYCASCMKWSIGVVQRDRPPEFYILKAIEALRARLGRLEAADSWSILSIYALAVSEMWAQNYEAATAHLSMIHSLVTHLGGMTNLEPYLMESILLCEKYVSIGKFEPSGLPPDWEPAPLPGFKMGQIQSLVEPILGDMAQGFYGLVGDLLEEVLLRIITDIVTCIQAAAFHKLKPTASADDQRWLFLRHQALVSRLLSFQPRNSIQACTRIALIIWLLKITAYFGAQRWSMRLLSKLKGSIIGLESSAEWSPSTLLLWMACLGAMTAEYTEERDWFVVQIARSTRSVDIPLEKEPLRQLLRKYFFVDSEDGLQFFRMVRAAREVANDPGKGC